MQKVIETQEGMKVTRTTINEDGHLVVTYEPKMTAREFVESCFDGCVVRHDKIHNKIIYNKDGESYFELKKYNNGWVLWCSYQCVWDVLERQYGMKYSDVQCLIRYVVKETYNMGLVDPILLVSIPSLTLNLI